METWRTVRPIPATLVVWYSVVAGGLQIRQRYSTQRFAPRSSQAP